MSLLNSHPISMDRVMITVAQVEAMPMGRVLAKYVNHKGSHSRMKLIKPRVYSKCDTCPAHDLKKVVKNERSCNVTLRTQCIKCAVEYINCEDVWIK